jgi:pimeloyl-ACP methyl ester carboxylesterase
MKLSAIDVGNGPAALLLHGQPGSAGDWSAVTARLRGRMRVVVPDRPGYGNTGGRAVGFRDNAAAAIELLDSLDIESAVVVGHSWATGIGLAAATRFPRRVRALVLAAPISPDIPAGTFDRLLAHPLVGPPVTRFGFWFTGLGLSLSPLRKLARAAAPALPPDQIATTAARWREESIWKSFYIEQQALVRELPTLAADLTSLDIFTTILQGTHDRVAPPVHARELAAQLPHANLVSVERAGHTLPLQRPDLVADEIARVASRA